jgi:GT2 family glycosyltransferase
VRWEADRLAEQYRDMSVGRWAPTARQFYTGNASIARHHLLECGGFDPAFRRAEDIELAYRLAERGLKFYFNPRAAGHHYAERSFASWLAIPYAYGCNNVSFSRRKGRAWLLARVYTEFSTRHPLIQALTRLCLDRPVLSAAVTAALIQVMHAGSRLKLNRLAGLTCSGIFNLRFYQGIADGLGGRKAFFSGIEARQSN